MRILTWNINGLATVLQYHPWAEKKSYEVVLNALEADIICLQEIKCQRSKLTREMALVPGYDAYFSFPKKKHGYSGVAVYVKQPLLPLWTEEGITGVYNKKVHDPDLASFLTTLDTDPETLDAEGRCIIMDFKAFVLFNIYFPNDSSEVRRNYKMDYHQCVRRRVDDYLKQGRQVVLVGDINAVHEEIDHCDPKQSKKEHGIEDFKALPHRQWVDQILEPRGPLVDLCRKYHPNRRGMFTCWNMRYNARPANYGTRIDYVLASKGIEKWFKFADIRADILGSDHCPVYADLHDTVTAEDGLEHSIYDLIKANSEAEPSALLAKNFDAFSDKQKKLSLYFSSKSSTATTAAPKTSPSNISSVTDAITTSAIATTQSRSSPTPSPSSSTIHHSPLQKRPSQSPPSSSTSLQKKRKSSGSPGQNQKLLKAYFASTAETNSATASPSGNSEENSQDSSAGDDTKKRKYDSEQNYNEDDKEEAIDIEALMTEAKERQETKQSWQSLFKPKPVPRCRVHNEPCKEMTVMKKGPNQGRQFYLCSRPFGPKDDPSREYQCNFFQWKH